MMKLKKLCVRIALALLAAGLLAGQLAQAQGRTPPPPPGGGSMSLTQTLSDEAQRNTIAFDGLAFLTGNLGADSFFPPGKVADFWGFQFLRDNDPSGMGHNTDFLTRAALNMLQTLTPAQRTELIALAQGQVAAINRYGYARFVLMDAFRRLLVGDVPAGSAGLDQTAVQAYSAQLYQLDGEISYQRAQVMGTIISQFSASQRAYLDAMVGRGMLSWPNVAEPADLRGLDRDVKVAVMTYAGDMFSWYAGSVDADVYFCPERQGTYFGSFYVKDAPAVGNPGYSIPVTMTGEMGETFLRSLSAEQAAAVTGLVEAQKPALYAIVDQRTAVATALRRFMAGSAPDAAQILALMETYGRLDGEIIYRYATAFAQVNATLTPAQRTQFTAMRSQILGSLMLPSVAYLYSHPIAMTAIANTDFLFLSAGSVPTATPAATKTPSAPAATPTQPAVGGIASVSPASAIQGQRGVEVKVTLMSETNPPGTPRSVKIGSVTGRNVRRAGRVVTATFDFPANEAVGRKDVVVSFGAAAKGVVLARPGGFEVRAAGALPTPTRRPK
jgi:hypothetical protein